ncbi:hypothetical protein KM043_009299 [Ampulex compressa]|nr:hypothetical protein KM043_009299 [Ampulex compressa]
MRHGNKEPSVGVASRASGHHSVPCECPWKGSFCLPEERNSIQGPVSAASPIGRRNRSKQKEWNTPYRPPSVSKGRQPSDSSCTWLWPPYWSQGDTDKKGLRFTRSAMKNRGST